MGRAVTADVIGRAVALALALAAVLLDLGFYAVIGAAAGGALASLVVAWLVTRPLVAIRPHADLAVWRGLLRVSIPLGLALAINQIYLRADTLIISISKPFEQVALYTLAYRILELTLVVGAVFVNSVLPVLSEAIVRDETRARRVIRDSTDLMVVIGAPLAAGGLVLAPDIVRLAGGPDFAGAAAPLRLLLVSGAFILVNGIFGIALIAKDRQLSTLWLNVVALAFNVALNLVLVPKYGIVAAATVTVASELLILAGSYVLMRRHLGYFPIPATLLPALAAAAAMAGLLALAAGAPLPVLVPAGAAVYCALLAAISPTSRRLLAGLRA
jgi:O-antigen/teichoic acid export membrane protein